MINLKMMWLCLLESQTINYSSAYQPTFIKFAVMTWISQTPVRHRGNMSPSVSLSAF